MIFTNDVHKLMIINSICRWSRDFYSDVKLTYARDRIVEPYFYTFGAFHEEENSQVRIIVTKVFVLLALMDDTYDVHATSEECQMLDEAIQRYICCKISIAYL